MRTTIVFESDVAKKLESLVRAKKGSLRSIVNGLLRKALSGKIIDSSPVSLELKTFSSPFAVGIDPVSLNALSDELAIDEFERKLGR